MNRLIALYRGINVLGRNSVQMESLRAMHVRLGHRGVTSYIQSGNVIFEASGQVSRIRSQIAERFAREFGFSARVIVLSTASWSEILRGNPYPQVVAAQPTKVHAFMCDGKPDVEGLKALQARTRGNEAFTVAGRVIYVHTPDGFGNSKFASGLENACGVPTTARNWRTIEAIWRMLEDADADKRTSRK